MDKVASIQDISSLSTGKPHGTEILMVFVFDDICLIKKLFNFNLFILAWWFSYSFIFSDNDNLCFKFGILLWSCFTFLFSLYSYIIFYTLYSLYYILLLGFALFLTYLLDGSHFFKESAGIICLEFEAFSGGFIC